jgi:hypothetical protein
MSWRFCRHAAWTAIVALAVVGCGLLAGSARASFGVERFEMQAQEEEGMQATQAGARPYSFTTTFLFNHHPVPPQQQGGGLTGYIPDGDVKDLEATLPAGLVVYPQAVEKCSQAELAREACRPSSQVGEIDLSSGLNALDNEQSAVFNMTPSAGEPARLGFSVSGLNIIVTIAGNVNPERGYALSASVSNIEQYAVLDGTKLTLWGDPSAASHDDRRGPCFGNLGQCGITVPRVERSFLRLPSSCGESFAGVVRADSWQEPGIFTPLVETVPAPGMAGCEELQFTPSLAVTPETEAADTPTGLDVRLSLPQHEGAGGLGEADLRDASVVLPAGLSISPSAANGLGACSEEEIGLGDEQTPTCPDSSKVGTVEVRTPLLEKPLVGSVYVAQQGNGGAGQGSNPFGSLAALYVVAEGSGVVVKLPGVVRLDPSTGQVSAEFGEDPVTHQFLPQLPFSELRVSFFGGPRAALVTPSACGSFTTSSQLVPWSAPFSGPAASPQSTFAVSSGCGGGFSPTLGAGTTSSQAGGYSPLVVTFSRQDSEQDLGGVQVRTPPGLLGALSHVVLCGEPQAQAGTCGAESEIGSVTAAAGAGPDPVWVTGGRAYLTGPYKGAPFGLSIVVPAVAGPFNLGNVVVRAAVSIDSATAAVTITSDPLPQILQGIPLQLKTVSVDVNRPGFIFNPTSCAAMSIAATLQGSAGASANVSAPFQASGCRSLPFNPSFAVSTRGAATRTGNGASLDVGVSQKSGEANIASVHVSLPKQLPARLTTIQQACPSSVFDADPAACPAGSLIGAGTAHTPVLPVALTGPAYLVSHGGAAFPDVVVVLQGEGVRVDLTGSIAIKGGITSSAFQSVPDAPIQSFELNLPEGPHSALASPTGGLCGKKLTMPTTITAQNGAQTKQSTGIQVSGCPKAKKAKAKKARKASLGHGGQRRGK